MSPGTEVSKDSHPHSDLTRLIIGCAIKVHRELGPGLLESTYQRCLEFELTQAGLEARSEVGLPLVYGNVRLDVGYRIDMIVCELVVLEIKSSDGILPIHESQLLTYLKLSGREVGLIINFNVPKLTDGIKRKVLTRKPLASSATTSA